MASRRGRQGAFRLPQVPRIQLPDVAPGALWHVNFSLLDDGGPFAWPRDARAGVLLFWLQELNRAFDRRDLERVRVEDADGAAHHTVETDRFSERARARFGELQALDNKWAQGLQSEMFVARVCMARDSTQRVWGVLDAEETASGYVFRPVWWDPLHQVCPDDRRVGAVPGPCQSGCLHGDLAPLSAH